MTFDKRGTVSRLGPHWPWASRISRFHDPAETAGCLHPAGACTRKRSSTMKKPRKKRIPTFKTDKEAEDFVASADLTEYDLSGGQPVHFEFEKKDARINMRIPDTLLSSVKRKAAAR